MQLFEHSLGEELDLPGPIDREELHDYIRRDVLSHGLSGPLWRLRITNHLIGFQYELRKLEYLMNARKIYLRRVRVALQRLRFRRLSERFGFTIPPNTFDAGLCIVHRGTIVVNAGAHVAMNCRIHQGVTIGSVDGASPRIGKNVWIGAGAAILGGISIGDGVAIGANSVVTSDIVEGTWAGVPARKISDATAKRWMRTWYD